jgi:hypothetical protein
VRILEFSRQIFEKSSDIKLHEIRLVGAELYADRRMDGHEEANGRAKNSRENPTVVV